MVERGQSLFEVDGRGVPLLYGACRCDRNLASGADNGYDVLPARGEPGRARVRDGVTAEGRRHFDSATAAAVRRWQKALGLDQTGSLSPTDFVFEPGAVRITKVDPQIGSTVGPGGPVLDATSTDRGRGHPARRRQPALVHAGDPEQVELPDGSTVDGDRVEGRRGRHEVGAGDQTAKSTSS